MTSFQSQLDRGGASGYLDTHAQASLSEGVLGPWGV